jgi:hypothetical protein
MMIATDAEETIRHCACTGCSAPHHQAGTVAKARWYLDLPHGPREEVCGTCANRRTQHPTRAKWLTPIPGQRSQRLTKHFAFALKPDTARALLLFLHEVELERGQRTTWDEAFKRLLAEAGRPVEESRE